jgi:hypothetical protein
MDRLAAKSLARRGNLLLRLAWAASLLLLVMGLAAGYAWRAQAIHIWPPAAHLYQLLGLAGVDATPPR